MRYHLRVMLRPDATDAEKQALWRIIRAGKIDEVAFFVPHVGEHSPGLGTEDECRECVDSLRPTFDRLREAGIAPSLNVWWTLSFSDFPALRRSLRDEFDFRRAVSADGRESCAVACPLDGNWREYVKGMYRTFAQLHPARLWMDDDVRATLLTLRSACFCEACLGEMERRTGREFTRQGVHPHPARAGRPAAGDRPRP